MKYVIKVTDIQDAIQQPIRPIVAKDLNNTMFVSTKMPPLMKTIFHYSDGTTSESSDTVITKSSYESQIPEGESLTGVEIGNNVTSIGDQAFYFCMDLTSITIPSSVTSIGSDAFSFCSSLSTVTIEEGLISIGISAFDSCDSLTTINIPNSLRYADSPFLNVNTISTILYNSHIFVYMPDSYSGEYTIPNGIETIASGAFYNCDDLSNIEIPNSVTSIGDQAFWGCASLTSIMIPDSVENIGYESFTRCDNLSNIIIGTEPSYTRLSYIGQDAFMSISYSPMITCNAIQPPTIDRSAGFTNNFTIYVPAESVAAYKASEFWSAYANRIYAISE